MERPIPEIISEFHSPGKMTAISEGGIDVKFFNGDVKRETKETTFFNENRKLKESKFV